MEIEILYRPSYSLAMLKLSGCEQVRVETGSLVTMSAGVKIDTVATGGLFKSLGRSLFSGESFFRTRTQLLLAWLIPQLPAQKRPRGT